jgi:hypothetical protein
MTDQPGAAAPAIDLTAIEDTDNSPKTEDGEQDDLDQSQGSAYDDDGTPEDGAL